MEWSGEKSVGERLCVWASDTEALRPFEVPEVSPEASRIHTCACTRIHPPRRAPYVLSSMLSAVRQMGQKKRWRKDATLCPGNQRNFASSGLPRFPRDAESTLVTVDLLKSLMSTRFRSEDRYYQFCAAEMNDDRNGIVIMIFIDSDSINFHFIIALINNGEF